MRTAQILIAEDNLADLILVREALAVHQIEHQLHVAGDGEEAIRLIGRIGPGGDLPVPDVFLLDLNLPKMDGITVLKSFRGTDACASTPVIIVSSSEMPREREQAAQLGISRYFRKPSNLAGFLDLGRVVREVLNGIAT